VIRLKLKAMELEIKILTKDAHAYILLRI